MNTCVAFFSNFAKSPLLTQFLILHLRGGGGSKTSAPICPNTLYLRTFDVISGVTCVLPQRKRRPENIALYPNFDVISEVQ